MLIEHLVTVVLGAFVGLAGGYAGIGGAPFLVAALVLLLDMDQHVAQGTILAVMLGPMSLPGVLVMRDRVALLIPQITLGVVAYALFSNLGARLAFSLQTTVMQICFGLLLIALGINYLRPRTATGDTLDPNKPTIGEGPLPFTHTNVAAASAVIGVVGGLFGIGAGVVMVPLFISLFGLHKDDARALSLAILLPPVSIGAIFEYHEQSAIHWPTAIIVFVTYFATNYFGARLGRLHSSRRFLKVTGALLTVLGLGVVGVTLRM